MDESLQRTVCACVFQLAETLKPEYVKPLRAVDFDGKPLSLFAKAVGITPDTAAARLRRVRAALGERIRASCGICATPRVPRLHVRVISARRARQHG
jgi:DNA-directed RNA polymerase specialized sigma24 family protein